MRVFVWSYFVSSSDPKSWRLVPCPATCPHTCLRATVSTNDAFVWIAIDVPSLSFAYAQPHRGTALREDMDMYKIFGYLTVFRADELGYSNLK